MLPHRFLDVGSGCGVLVAAAAVVVGSSGSSLGIDCKAGAVALGRANVETLAAASPDFCGAAGPISFLEHNVFVPSHDLRVPPPGHLPSVPARFTYRAPGSRVAYGRYVFPGVPLVDWRNCPLFRRLQLHWVLLHTG